MFTIDPETIQMLHAGLDKSARMSLSWANEGRGQLDDRGRQVQVTDSGWIHLREELLSPSPDLTMREDHTALRHQGHNGRPAAGRPPIGGAVGGARKVDFMCSLADLADLD